MLKSQHWTLLIPLVFWAYAAFPQEHKPLNISFTENKGQWNQNILYRADLPHGALFLEKNAFTYNFLDENDIKAQLAFKGPSKGAPIKPLPSNKVHAHAYQVEMLNSLRNPVCHSDQAFPDYKNYYLGNDPKHWASKVHHYRSVSYENIYPGTELFIAQEQGSLKYTFLLKAGVDPGQIKMKYNGNVSLRLKKNKLKITTSVNEIEEQQPLAWQIGTDGQKTIVSCSYKLENDVVSFVFPDGIDPVLPLTIDPVLVFSSYSGSTADNWGFTATYDKEGFLYGGGISFGIGYPITVGAYMVNFGGGKEDIAITKFDTTGSVLVYSTYLGGDSSEVPTSLVVDNYNNLFVLAITGSANYPTTPGCFDASFNFGSMYAIDNYIQFGQGSDLAISKFSSDGSALLASTYYGGSENDGFNFTAPLKKNYADDGRGEIKVTDNGDVYVVSSTSSANLPMTTNAAQPNFGGIQDAFVFKMNGSLSSLIWSTYLGGSNADAGYSLAIGQDGRVYVGGGTKSTNFPTTSASLQPASNGGGCDGYICCLNSSGTSFLYSTYYGAAGYDQVFFVDLDKEGHVFAMGQTDAPGNFYISNALWNMPGGGQFVTKFTSNLQTRIWSTTFGTGNGGPDISPTAFMADYCHNIYISGWGSPASFLNGFGGTTGLPITSDAFQSTTDNSDYYFLVFDGNASNIVYGTFFGGAGPIGEHVDGGTSRFDKKGCIYQAVCAGCSQSNAFPTTPGAWSNTNNSWNCNLGVIKFDFKINLVVADFIQPAAICTSDTIFFQNASTYKQNSSVNMHWNFGDGGTSALVSPKHVYHQSGIFIVTLIVNDTASCNVNDTAKMSVYVLADTTRSLAPQDVCKGYGLQIGVSAISDPSLTYNWIPATNLSNPNVPDPIASPTTSTFYKLLISNGFCTDTLLQPIKVWDLKADAGSDAIVCEASYHLMAHGHGDQNLHFLWSSNASFTDTLNLTLNDSTASVGLVNQSTWFYIKVYNDHCFAVDSVNISFSILVSPSIGRNPSCPNVCDGFGWVTVPAGFQNITFLWNTGSTNDSIFNLCDGTYTVTVTDAASCVSVASFTLTDPPALSINPIAVPIPCIEKCKGEVFLDLNGGIPPFTFLWNNGDTAADIHNLCKGIYSVTVTDDRGCKTIASASVAVDPFLVNIHVVAQKDTLFQGQSTYLYATVLNGCTYQWSPIIGLTDPGEPNTAVTPMTTTAYHVLITDLSGCIYEDSVIIYVKDVYCREPYLFVPNAFTPNGDNINDKIYVKGIYLESIEFFIFNRWGEKVFETRDLNSAWDGTYRNKACEPGVYVYNLVATCFNKEVFRKKGNITLIR